MTVRDLYDVFDFAEDEDGFMLNFGKSEGLVPIRKNDKTLVEAFGSIVVERFVNDQTGGIILFPKTITTFVREEAEAIV